MAVEVHGEWHCDSEYRGTVRAFNLLGLNASIRVSRSRALTMPKGILYSQGGARGS